MTREERENAIRCLKLWIEREPYIQTYKTCLEALEQEPTVTSTNNSGEMTYPQVEGITPTVVNEDIYQCSCGYGWNKNKVIRFHFCPNCGKAVDNDYKYIKNISNPTGIEFDIDIPKEVDRYRQMLKHPVVKHVMGMDEEQEQIDFVQSHKKIPVTLTVEGDCISRQAVLDVIEREQFKGDAISEIEKLPPVTPKPKTGHWIDREIYDADRWKCSECGRTEPYKENYCPKCGADMRGEQHD